ncbi:hypothetical protein CONLIGDRAFT_1030 [Coniochaeta ligniaria NRRL 30616]|uniref:Uncharacterized protein n=1 Tax=Coniochaeta ligniaria NRRL 30616 TaxID=1408157 RepID=A0A1J7J2J2_9PEZI|nr:hypothetical protein CONLIGDRAFT_1030 [Coniochaeta ligniaria NRRL 30616]
MSKPTYFIPPTFHNPPDGPLKLGQLIVAVNDPGNGLDKPEPFLQHHIEVHENEQTVESHGYTSSSATDLNLFAKAVQVLAVKAGISLSAQTHATILSHIERLQVRFIQPDDDYVKASLLRPAVQAKLKTWLWQKRAFMITGLCIAHPTGQTPDTVAVENTSDRRAEANAEVRGPAGSGSAGAGGRVSARDTTSHSLKLVPRRPFVYAFQLRTCRYGRRRITNRPMTDGAVMNLEERRGGQRDVSSTGRDDADEFEFVFDEVADEDLGLEELGVDAGGLTLVSARNEVTGLPCDIIVPVALAT